MKRITKREARKRWETDKPFTMVACKLYPFGGWHPGYCVHPAEEKSRQFGITFDKLVQEYTWYNCNWETGYYPAFYNAVDM